MLENVRCECGRCNGVGEMFRPTQTKFGFDGNSYVWRWKIDGIFYITLRGSLYCAHCNTLIGTSFGQTLPISTGKSLEKKP